VYQSLVYIIEEDYSSVEIMLKNRFHFLLGIVVGVFVGLMFTVGYSAYQRKSGSLKLSMAEVQTIRHKK